MDRLDWGFLAALALVVSCVAGLLGLAASCG